MKVDETVSHISNAVVGGSWVIYLGEDAKGGSVVGASAVDGSDHKVITRHGPGPKGGWAAASLSASTDGSRVAYYGYGAGRWLRVLGLDGKEHARVPGVAGAHVYFLGNTHLVSGSNRKVLVRKIGEAHGRIIAIDAIVVPPSGF